MEEMFKAVASYVALGLEAVAVLIIAYGAIAALAGLFQPNTDALRPFAGKKRVYLSFGVWLLLGLEFELAADIVRTAISPTWNQVGELAAIAAIRTFLNYFLERDVEKYTEEKIPRYVCRIVGIKQEKEGGKRQKPKGASKPRKSNPNAKPTENRFDDDFQAAERSLLRL